MSNKTGPIATVEDSENFKFIQVQMPEKVHRAFKLATIVDATKKNKTVTMKSALADVIEQYVCFHLDAETVDVAIKNMVGGVE